MYQGQVVTPREDKTELLYLRGVRGRQAPGLMGAHPTTVREYLLVNFKCSNNQAIVITRQRGIFSESGICFYYTVTL